MNRRAESVETFDQTVALPAQNLEAPSWLVICPLSRLIFKPKTDLHSDLEFLDFVFFNQPAHFRHFEPVDVAQ